MKKTAPPADLRTCVTLDGRFRYGLHQPRYTVANMRAGDALQTLGRSPSGQSCDNAANYPAGDVDEPGADPIFEIPNAFPFRGTTYIGKRWADRTARDIDRICIPQRPETSLNRTIRDQPDSDEAGKFIQALPRPLKLALAVTTTDADDLIPLAESCCEFIRNSADDAPLGLVFEENGANGRRPRITDEQLFDAVANNPNLPDAYKVAMVLRPGIQGNSEIVGEWRRQDSHIFEYLRRNSYIAWGHYAANMADDAVRYAAGDLTAIDGRGLRHLYYQRTYVRLAQAVGLNLPARRRELSTEELEQLRRAIQSRLSDPAVALPFGATLWGWNYGFDYAPSGYRLHASHQQIHQQYALIPNNVTADDGGTALSAYACGDMVQAFAGDFRRKTGRAFFDCYLRAIAGNRRMDGRADRPNDLVVFQDEHVLLFAPKAQTSQWELQLMTRAEVGNILEADESVRSSLDRAMLTAMKVLTAMGAAMITVIEYSKRFRNEDADQRLLYCFLPRLPESPGAFSEAQLRWINGHYPEDFAEACRRRLDVLWFEPNADTPAA